MNGTIRTLVVEYGVPVPGLDVEIPLTDTVILEDGYSDEDSIPAILAVSNWGKVELDHLINIRRVRPSFRKSYADWDNRPSETRLAYRRGWDPFAQGHERDCWRAQSGGILQKCNDPGALSGVFAAHVAGHYNP